ncbi:MAG: hypothetical protein AB1767_14165 [Bacillota bacterium]
MSTPAYKIVRLTSKRQFTIPKIYFDRLRLGENAKCYMEGNRLVIEERNRSAMAYLWFNLDRVVL